MKNPKLFATCLIILFSFAAKAEIINGPANFRIKPNGPILFSLKDGEEVECGLLVNGWYKVSISVVIADKKYSGGSPLKKGTTLLSFEKKIIAVALGDIPEETLNASEGDVDIYGYVFKTNIKSNSIPENTLDSVYMANTHPDYTTLKDFMLKGRYQNQRMIDKILPKFSEYCIYESTVVDLSPGYRIGLIFENNDLIAVEHSRPLKIADSKEYVISGRNKIFIVKPPTGLSVSAFVKKMNKAFEGAD